MQLQKLNKVKYELYKENGIMKEKSLAKNAVFNVIYSLLNIIFPIISATYISRVIMADGIGKVAYAQNIVSYFLLIAPLGIPTYGVREIAKVKGDNKRCNRTFSELFIINFISTTICLICYYIFIIKPLHFKEEILLYLICGLLLFFNYINVDWFYQGKEEYSYITIRSSIIKMISIFCLIIFVRDNNDYILYALITSVAIVGNYIFNIINLRKYVKFTLQNLTFKKHLRPICTLIICTVATSLYSKVDITMLGTMCSDSVVGYYTNAQKMIALILGVTTAFSTVFLPRLSYYYNNEKEKFNELVSLGVKIILFLSIPFFIGLIAVANNLIPVMFGKSFIPAVSTIRILSILILIKGIGDILCYQVIISSGNERKFIFSYVAAAIINICLNLILIPKFKQDGAALASVVSELTVNMTLLIVSLKIVKLKIDKNFFKSIFISVIFMLISVLVINKINKSYFIILFIQILIGGLIYLLINIILKNNIINMIFKKIKSR